MSDHEFATLLRIEDAGLNASAPPQQRVLDGWLLRFSPGKAKRARCINALSTGRLALVDKLARCERAYAASGLPMIVRITPFSEPPELDLTLEAMGLHRFDDTRVMLLPDLHSASLTAAQGLRAVDADAYAHQVGALRDSPLPQREAHAERMRNSPVPYCGFMLERDGAPMACGQYVLEGDVVGLYDVFTVPDVRCRGHASALCAELLAAQLHGEPHPVESRLAQAMRQTTRQDNPAL